VEFTGEGSQQKLYSLPLTGDYLALDAAVTPDGGLVILAAAGTDPNYLGTCLLIRLNDDNRILWTRELTEGASFNSVILTSDEDFLLTGSRPVGDYPLGDMVVAKVSPKGTILWSKTFDYSEQELLVAAVATPDGGCLAVGDTYSVAEGIFLRLNRNGLLMWDQPIDLPAYQPIDQTRPYNLPYPQDIQAAPDGGFLFLGSVSAYHPENDPTNDIDAVVVKFGAVEPLVNSPPAIRTPRSFVMQELDPLVFTVAASDIDGDPLTLSVRGLPAGSKFSGGKFTWTPKRGQAGTYTATFSASDGDLSVEQTVTLTVLPAAPLPPKPQTSEEDSRPGNRGDKDPLGFYLSGGMCFVQSLFDGDTH
jgi:hypothetical protein